MGKVQQLKKGDVVEIIAPASGCERAEYELALSFVSSFGLTPKARSYDDVIKPGLCANSVDYRFQHLMEAIESKDSQAVWCLKGGYGTQQLLERLDELVDTPKQKLFIGFSDITILLNYFAERWGWTSLYGPMPWQVGKVSDNTWRDLAGFIFGEKEVASLECDTKNRSAKIAGVVEGKLLGGCLSLMQALVGTGHMPDLTDAILLLEDDKFETPRRVDRILNHMQRAGVFYDVAAVVLGNFLEHTQQGSKDELELKEVLDGFAWYLDECGIPLIQNTKLGHADDMLTVPIGAVAKIELGDKPQIVCGL